MDQRKMSEKDGLLSPRSPKTGDLTFFECVVNMTKISVGVGILALPAQSWAAGWANIIIYLTIVGASAGFCSITFSDVIDKCKKSPRGRFPMTNMEEVAYAIWGSSGKAVVRCLFFGLLGSAGILFMIVIGSMYAMVLPIFVAPDSEGVSTYLTNDNIWRFVMCALIAPVCCLKDMNVIAKFSFIGLLASATTIVAICYFGIAKLSDPSIDRTGAVAFKPGLTANVGAFVAYVWGYGAPIVVPGCKAEMKEPSKFNFAIITAHVITTILYLIVCLVSYFGYASQLGQIYDGEYVSKWMGAPGSQIVKGVPDDLSILAIAAVAAVGLSCSISYPLVLNGMFSGIESSCPSLTKSEAVRCSWRTSLVVVTSLIACVFGNLFGPFLNIIACLFFLPLNVGLPFAGYWTLVTREEGSAAFKNHKGRLVIHLILSAIAVVAAVQGTWGAVQDFIASLNK